MNREQRREFAKRAKARGISDEHINAYIAWVNSGGNNIYEIKEGDKVLLNVRKIISGVNYSRMVPAYKKFIEESEGVVFTAHIERGCLVSLMENPKWLFWIGDLVKYKTENKEDED